MIPQVMPMLATAARPFDSFEHFFEIKWDGVRALAAVADRSWRLWGRNGSDYASRYPELEVLRGLPAGTLVDGELVRLRDGRPDLESMLQRHQLSHAFKIRHASRQSPVHFVVFDLLYQEGRSLMQEPLHQRRDAVLDLLAQTNEPRLVGSEAIVGPGQKFFAEAIARGHEGVMAKHRHGRYVPGRRSAVWQKIKPVAVTPCVIIGYRLAGDGLESVLVAAEQDGVLRYAGEVSAGFTQVARTQLAIRLATLERPRPVLPVPLRARWVAPELYCQIQWQQRTARGRFRGASFRGYIEL